MDVTVVDSPYRKVEEVLVHRHVRHAMTVRLEYFVNSKDLPEEENSWEWKKMVWKVEEKIGLSSKRIGSLHDATSKSKRVVGTTRSRVGEDVTPLPQCVVRISNHRGACHLVLGRAPTLEIPWGMASGAQLESHE